MAVLTADTVIGGRYRVERKLGAGGVGVVWAGVSLEDGVKVAIKKLLPAASAHAELVTRFKREAELLARIRSQYVARVVDFLSDQTHGLVLIMEFVEGQALNEILRRTSISVEQAIDIGWDVLAGVADLHRQQIVHRDLKPGNVIIKQLPDGRPRAVIVDFGMSRIMVNEQHADEVSALTRTGTALGTLEYMAPEQMINSRNVTAAADIYAVGAMLYRAVAGHHMFGDLNGPSLARTKLLNEAPPLLTGRADPVAQRFEAIVMRMVQVAPEQRYQRAEDVLTDLSELRAFPSGHSHSVPPSMPSHPSIPDVAPHRPSSPTAASIQSTSYDAPAPGRVGIALVLVAAIVMLGVIAAGGIISWQRGLLPSRVARPAASAPQAPPSSTIAPATSLEPIAPDPAELSDAAADRTSPN